MQTLTIDEVVAFVKNTPESAVDWKTDFRLPSTDDDQGEFIKDLTAIANACVVRVCVQALMAHVVYMRELREGANRHQRHRH